MVPNKRSAVKVFGVLMGLFARSFYGLTCSRHADAMQHASTSGRTEGFFPAL
jgi:hypothetical protein